MGSIGKRIKEFRTIRFDWMLMIILCSFLGYITENLWNYFTCGYVDNRNMFLPFLIGYGIAILFVYILFGVPKKKRLWLYAIEVFIFTSAAELALGYLVEWIGGFRYWDYSDIPLHFTPYVSLITSIGFTTIITLFMNVHFTPLMERFRAWCEHKWVCALTVIMIILMASDFVYSFLVMFENGAKNEHWSVSIDPFVFFKEDESVIIVSMFFVFSFLGWCMESAYISFLNKKWTNRGFMFAPICPIYGFGELIGYKLIKLLPQNYILLFFVGAVFATLFEYLVAKFLIWKTGYLWWDYTKRPFNYKGILCLESTIAWGVITVLVVGFLHEGIHDLLATVPTDILAVIDIAMIMYIFGDTLYSIRKFRREGLKAEENNILKVR